MKRQAVTLIEVLVAIAIVGLLIALLLPAVQAARESSRRVKCATNLRQITLALHQYSDAHGVVPYYYANYSVHVRLLPYLEQEALYRRFDFGVNATDYKGPLDSVFVRTFECPSDGGKFTDQSGAALAATNYFGNSGSGAQRYGHNGVFPIHSNVSGFTPHLALSAITDGLSQTALFAEVAAGDRSNHSRRCVWSLVGSGTPNEFEPFAQECAQARVRNPAPHFLSVRGRPWNEHELLIPLYNHVLPPNSPSCLASANPYHSIFTSTSMHGSFVNVALADGSVQTKNEDLELLAWRKLGSRNGEP